MKISENVSLANLTTMKIGGLARYVLEIEKREDLPRAFEFLREKKLKWFVLGGGSNVISRGDFDGAILLIKIRDFSLISREKTEEIWQIGAGENTDEIIEKLCEKNLSGVECLSLIPGKIGALPVQNVGAYGQEISQTLIEMTVFNSCENRFEILKNSDCKFAYRDSIFKSQKNRKYIICDIKIRLKRENLARPYYESLEKYFAKNDKNWAKISRENSPKNRPKNPMEIREAVIKIRNEKLPKIDEIPSAGSFFKNPIVDAKIARKLLKKFPEMPHFKVENSEKNAREKLAAGWLIDRANLKGFAKFGFQIFEKNALVIVNISKKNSKNLRAKNNEISREKIEKTDKKFDKNFAKNSEKNLSENSENSAENLAKFQREIVEKVREKFGVILEQEPENL